MQNYSIQSSWLPWKAQNNELHPQEHKKELLHSASYTKTRLPPKMVARLPKMVAFSAEFPPDGAVSSVKWCYNRQNLPEKSTPGILGVYVFPQGNSWECACADSCRFSNFKQ